MWKQCLRLFSTKGTCFGGYSTVKPVHHLVKVKKSALMPRYKEVLVPKNSIESIGYRPTDFEQDRVDEHYHNTLKSDLMLSMYQHDAEVIYGLKMRDHSFTSPYALYRKKKMPVGGSRPTRDIKPIGPLNVPELKSIVLNLYAKDAFTQKWLNISSTLQIAQITNVKPKKIKGRMNDLSWKIRRGKRCGCKVELTGVDMHQFLLTLTELVLPRIRTFTGIKDTSGDTFGNISMGLNPEDVKFFPEIEHFQELYPNLFGFHITFKTSSRTDDGARLLLSSLGLPFQNAPR